MVDGRSVSSSPLCQIIEIPDQSLNEKLVPANDNYSLITPSMESFEEGSVLSQRDYTKPSRHEEIGLIAVLCIGALAVFVLKLANVI